VIEPNLTPQARAFFTHLWRMPTGAPAWAYWWHLPEKCSVWFDATKTLWEGLPRGEKDIYFGIHPCAQIPTENSKGEPATPVQVRSQILCIGAINCLFTEFDQKDGAELATVEALTPAPSVVVASGGGWHCYWLLAEPYALAGAAERNRAIDLQRRWVEHHGGDKDAKDLARVLRVPGTMNHKPKRNRAIVAFLRCDMDQIYLLDDLAGILPAPTPRLPTSSLNGNGYPSDASDWDKVEAAARALSPRRAMDHDTWLAVGMAINSADSGGAGWALFDDFSRQCPDKYDEQHNRARWNSFKPGKGKGIGTLFQLADTDSPGWRNEYRAAKHPAGATQGTRTDELSETAPPEEPDYMQDGGELVASPQAGTELHTDLGNARRFSRLHGGKLRYVQVWGWLHWTGQNWQRDDTGAIMELAKATADGMFTEAGALNRQAARLNEAMATAGEHERKRLAEAADKATAAAKAARDWALRTQSRPRLEAMVALAQSEPGIAARAQDFDQDPWALNVLNGVIDLRTGELHPHDPQRMITALAPVRFTPGAQCPTFLTFLERIFDKDAELATYVTTFLGYSLTGNVDEQYLHVLWGSGANGKSTLIRVILDLLGNHYAGQAAPDLLLAGNDLRHPTEVADLRGRRFVAAIETGDNRRMNETLVKQLTGGDKVKARYMREDFFEFAPTWKLALVTNHKPRVAPSDALFRRLRLIPFTVTIPEDERDPRLLAKLQAEQEGILALLVRGCIAWRKAGALTAPNAVKLATGEYRSESDDLGKFLLESTDRVAGKEIQARTLYKEFGEWCEASGIRAMNQKQFGLKLADHGIEKRTDSSTHLTYYLDIVLRTNFRE
jgi:putative DNA primase/helicase